MGEKVVREIHDCTLADETTGYRIERREGQKSRERTEGECAVRVTTDRQDLDMTDRQDLELYPSVDRPYPESFGGN